MSEALEQACCALEWAATQCDCRAVRQERKAAKLKDENLKSRAYWAATEAWEIGALLRARADEIRSENPADRAAGGG